MMGDMLQQTYKIEPLPPAIDLETVPILKALARANRALAELKGRAATIPNQGILIDTLALQEAKASSEIENIVTTQDDLFQAAFLPESSGFAAAKEVALYRDAVKLGHRRLADRKGIIANSTLIEMFQLLKGRSDGFRNTPGTALLNETTGQVVYVPPQETAEIIRLMSELETYINTPQAHDPLISMALIHLQFESIHPFPDGNGRIGRILNVLYLVQQGLLDIPVLYLSRYVIRTKDDYYRLLQTVREEGRWEDWIIYMLNGVTETAETTLGLVDAIRSQMVDMKQRMRNELPKLYSQDLLNNLFRHPYTRIEFVVDELGVARQTAARYLDALAEAGFVEKRQAGRSNYFINADLIALFEG